jgi:hypothetical protein
MKERIDSLNIFPAIGYISCPQNSKILPNDELNNLFIKNLKEVLPKTENFKVNYLSEDYKLSDTLTKYFVKTIPKFSQITEETFSMIPLGDSFNKMIEDIPGRYFGIIFYNGFEQSDFGKKLATSVALGVATAVLTGGLFVAVSVPKDPYVITNFLIIDKKYKRFLFYKHRSYTGSPLNKDKLVRNFNKIFSDYQLAPHPGLTSGDNE